MADGTSDAVDGGSPDGAAAEWLARRARELGVDREVLVERIVAAYRTAEEGDVDPGPGDAVEERLADLEDRVGAAEDEFDEKIRDVRERVVQVKREADGKAPADHDHEALRGDVEDALAAVRAAEAATDALGAEVDALAERLDAGFENFEEVLSYLRDEADDLDRKATTLATALLSMRETLRTLAAAESRRARAEALQRDANVAGVTDADCGECGQSVTVAQLSAPECPFCSAPFEGVTAKSGWFGTHTLETGTKPALPTARSWLDEDGGDEDAWLGGETDTLEAMVDDADSDDGGGDDSFAWQGELGAGPAGSDLPNGGDVTPAEDVPAEDVPAEDVPAEDVPAEDVPAEDVPAEVVDVDDRIDDAEGREETTDDRGDRR